MRNIRICTLVSLSVVLILLAFGDMLLSNSRHYWQGKVEPNGRQLIESVGKPGSAQRPSKIERKTRLGQDTVPLVRFGSGTYYHSFRIRAISYAPDHGVVACAGIDGAVKCWNTTTNQRVFECKGYRGNAHSLHFSPDGRFLAYPVGEDEVVLLEVQSGREWSRFRGGSGESTTLAFTPDGKQLACAGNSKIISIWDIGSKKLHKQWEAGDDGVRSVAFSRDGKRFVCAGRGNTIQTWELKSGGLVGEWTVQNEGCEDIVVAPNGQTVALIVRASDIEHAVNVRDATSGREIGRSSGYYFLQSICFSQDGHMLASLHQGTGILFWDTKNSKYPFNLLKRTGIIPVAFCLIGRRLAVADEEHYIHLCDLFTEKVLGSGHRSTVTSLAFSPNRRQLVSASTDSTVRVWNLKEKTEERCMTGKNNLETCAVSPDAQDVAYGGFNREVGVVWIASGQRKWNRATDDTITVRSVLYCGESILAAIVENKLSLLNASNGHLISSLPIGPEELRCLAYSPASGTIAMGDDSGTIFLGHKPGFDHIVSIFGHNVSVNSLSFSPDGRSLASGSDDSSIRLWDVVTHEQIGRLVGHENSVTSLAFSPDGRLLVSGGQDNTVRLWEVASGQLIYTYSHHHDAVTSVAFSLDGMSIASASFDATVVIRRIVFFALSRTRTCSTSDLQQYWASLSSPNAFCAYRAMEVLSQHPGWTVSWCQRHLLPAQQPASTLVDRLIADLDHSRFAVRRRAYARLEGFGDLALSLFTKKLTDPSLTTEQRTSLRRLLHQDLQSLPTSHQMQQLRAVSILERIASPDARTLLRRIAQGTPHARLTQEAQRASNRLELESRNARDQTRHPGEMFK